MNFIVFQEDIHSLTIMLLDLFQQLSMEAYILKKFKLPDTKNPYHENLKHVVKISSKSFDETILKSDKDVAVLLLDSTKLTPDSVKILKSFNKAANRFKDLKIKSVKFFYYDTSIDALPKGFEKSENPIAYFLSGKNKKTPFKKLEELNTENIMLKIQSLADSKFDLPNFPHLDETEFLKIEKGEHIEDL